MPPAKTICRICGDGGTLYKGAHYRCIYEKKRAAMPPRPVKPCSDCGKPCPPGSRGRCKECTIAHKVAYDREYKTRWQRASRAKPKVEKPVVVEKPKAKPTPPAWPNPRAPKPSLPSTWEVPAKAKPVEPKVEAVTDPENKRASVTLQTIPWSRWAAVEPGDDCPKRAAWVETVEKRRKKNGISRVSENEGQVCQAVRV